MNWFKDGYGWSDGGGMIFMVILWIVIIGLGFWLVTCLTRKEKSVPREELPRQILDRRLASGEIDASQYAQARRLVDGHSQDVGQNK